MDVELNQVRIRLTPEKDVLLALKRRRAIKKDERGEYLPIQFDSKTFMFRPGEVVTVGKTVAKALIRSSAVIVGEDIDGDIKAAIVEIGSFTIGDERPMERRSLTACPVCNKDLVSLVRLARHINVAHKEDRPDLYVYEPRREPTNWNAATGETAAAQNTAASTTPAIATEPIDEDAGEGIDIDDNSDESSEISMSDAIKKG